MIVCDMCREASGYLRFVEVLYNEGTRHNFVHADGTSEPGDIRTVCASRQLCNDCRRQLAGILMSTKGKMTMPTRTAFGSPGAARAMRAASNRVRGGRTWDLPGGARLSVTSKRPEPGWWLWAGTAGTGWGEVHRDTARLILRGLLAPAK